MSKYIYSVAVIIFLMGLTGCTSQTRLAGKSYLIPSSGGQTQLAPLATITIAKTTWKEWMSPPFNVTQESSRGEDLNDALVGFAKDLFATVTSGTSTPNNGRTFQISLSIEDIGKGPKAGQATGAVSMSFLTLGLAAPKTMQVPWVCKIEMKVIRSDGITKLYKAEVETVFTENENELIIPQKVVFMHENTAKCFSNLLLQVKADANFWSIK